MKHYICRWKVISAAMLKVAILLLLWFLYLFSNPLLKNIQLTCMSTCCPDSDKPNIKNYVTGLLSIQFNI